MPQFIAAPAPELARRARAEAAGLSSFENEAAPFRLGALAIALLDRVVCELSGTRAVKSQIIRVPTLDKEDIPVTDQSNPHDQHDSELQLLLTVGIQGFRELVAWVAEGATPDARHARGSQVREVIDAVVKNTDSAKINQALLDEAERLSKETPR